MPLTALCIALGGAACTGPLLTVNAEYDRAVRAAERWVDRHPSEWVLRLEGSRALGRPSWSQACAANPPSGFVALRHTGDDTEIDFFFRCPIGRTASVQELQSRFSHVALSRLPHGIRSPGWRFDVLTPSSSFGEGVTFAAAGGGRMRIAVQTRLFAVAGRSTRKSCEPPADGPAEPQCFLQREHRIPLRLTLEVPSSLSGID